MMEMKVFLRTMWGIERYAKGLPLPDEDQWDFIQFCALRFLSGRYINTTNFYLFTDFVRMRFGDNRNVCPTKQSITLPLEFFEASLTEPRIMEDEIINRIDNARSVSRLIRKLQVEEQLILKFYFYDDLTLKEISEILCVSEASVSLRLKSIVAKLRRVSKTFAKNNNHV